MINPIWLRTFKTLLDTGHFTRTAEALNMTQPGVSQHIKKLEEACGYPLIKRFKKHFEPTPQGEQVYRYAIERLQEEESLLDQLGRDDPHHGEVRMACSGALALTLYPKLLALQCEHPNLSISLEAAPQSSIQKAVLAGHVDLGIVTEKPVSMQLDAREIGREPLALVVPARFESSDDWAADLVRLGLVDHPDFEHLFSLYLAHFKTECLARFDLSDIPVRGYINQVHQILLPIADGIGFTVLPKRCIDHSPVKDQLRILPAFEAICEPMYLITKRHRPLAARYQSILSVLDAWLDYH